MSINFSKNRKRKTEYTYANRTSLHAYSPIKC